MRIKTLAAHMFQKGMKSAGKRLPGVPAKAVESLTGDLCNSAFPQLDPFMLERLSEGEEYSLLCCGRRKISGEGPTS